MPYFTEPEEALDYIYNLLNNHRGELGLKFVGYADERFLPEYPAVSISYITTVDRELYATRQFRLIWTIQITVLHARMSTDHKTRTREDMQLAVGVKEKLHEDFQLGGGVIFGYVQQERPGTFMDDRGTENIATMLTWVAESREIF